MARDADNDELDSADRDELRRRHYGLLQELCVVLPGVQVRRAREFRAARGGLKLTRSAALPQAWLIIESSWPSC